MANKRFIITETDFDSIEEAIHVLRSTIQDRTPSTEAALNEARSALAGLLAIMPERAPGVLEESGL